MTRYACIVAVILVIAALALLAPETAEANWRWSGGRWGCCYP